uniref:Uncharacterized protein n=1 Tax=Tanacetum cinerariifolium TaxID=118510 RepID=A0A6L2LUW9_TANCI|nr:hypothetical protein [Tanacetum cinerariifolium]
MDMTVDQQVALNKALVPHTSRLRIGKSNFLLRSDITSKESTLQLVYDVLRLTPFYKEFLVTTDVSKIYMLEFWATVTVHHYSISFKMDNKKRIINLEYFREMLHICPRLPGQTFDELLFEEEILAFLRFLGHSGEIRKIIDEYFVYQVEHKDAKKSNEMYHPRDDQMFITIKLVSRHQNTQQFGVMLLVELTNEDIRTAPPKTKASVRKMKNSSDTTITPPTAAGTRLSTLAKGKQPVKSSKAKSLTMLSEVAMTEAEQMKLATKRNLQQTHISQASGSGADEGTSIIPGVLDVPSDESDEEISWKSSDEDDDDELSIHEEEAKDKESFDPIIQTPKNSDDEGNDDASLGLNVGGKEGQDAEDDDEELYRDVNINLEGQDVQMTDVHTTQEFEDTHVTLTSVNPDGQQQSSSVSSQFVTSMLNPSLDAGIDSLFETTPRVDVQASTTVAPLTYSSSSNHSYHSLKANFSEFVYTNQFVGSVSSILGIVERYMDQRINEAVKTVVQIQSDRLRDETQAENEEFLNRLDENIQKIIKEQVKEQVKVQVSKILPKIEKTVNEQLEAKVFTRSSNSSKTSYTMAANLSEMELKKILIKKIESNKSIQRSDEQMNLYKALVDAYESNKIILDTYGDTVTLKRCLDDTDKDEEPSTVSESAPVEEPMQTTQDLEEPSHQEFETGAADDQPIAEASQHPECDLAKQADSRSSFTELMDTPMDFSAFLMNQIEFILEEVYKATTDQLDWNNPEGQQYPRNLLKPLPLILNSRGRRVIPFDYFINNDLEYLRGGASSRNSTDLQLTGSRLEMSTQNVESSLPPNFRLSNGIITSIWIGSRKADKSNGQRTLCFQRLSKNVHKKHRHPMTYGRSSTRCRKLPKEAQSHKAGYNKDKQNRLMRIDKLHKFSDGTLNDVQTALDDRFKGIWMKYLPQAIWRKSDKERATSMIQAIDKQLKIMRIMQSLEKFVVTIRVTSDKNVKKISSSNAFLILEDFNPSLYELPFHKEVPGSENLLSCSSENEEKVFNPGILTSKGVHTSLIPELSHWGPKAFKGIKTFEIPMEIFPCSYGEDIRILDVPCLHFYPP